MTNTPDQKFDVPRHFNADKARTYDEDIPKGILGYDTLHRLIPVILGTLTAGTGRVLVVGAGTGQEGINLCRAYPGLSVTGCDPSPDMLAVARKRVADEGLKDRIDLKDGVVSNFPAGQDFDAATLVLVMHFIADNGGKAELLGAICDRLKPGAPFVLADMFGDKSSPAFADHISFWRTIQKEKGVKDEDIEKNVRHADRDTHPIPEERLFELLDEAGFGRITPFFRSLMFGGWVTRKKDP